jgi:transmembrane sensor
MKEPFDIADIIFKYLNGTLSDEENNILQNWLQKDIENQILLAEFQNYQKTQENLEFFESIDTPAAWEKINREIEKPATNRLAWAHHRFVKYAAAIILTGFFGYTFFNKTAKYKQTPAITKQANILKNDALPGGDKATLTLGDGSMVVLEDIKNGDVKNENGVKISKKDGQVVYEILPRAQDSGITYNTIKTPTGGQYSIILPDGSKVWLNSTSSLHFPTVFTGKQRLVELSGEGYFEISKNKDMPFIVQAGKTRVEVLGTHFNVMAYANETVSKTTLLEGSVKVGNESGVKTLNPGQQARVGTKINVTNADLDEAIAWKLGYFQFENEDLKTIMRQLTRWYAVEVTAEQNIPNKHFTAMISRNTTLSQVFKMLEMSGELKFTIEEGKVTIREK